jgi:GTP cyclohydrolase II
MTQDYLRYVGARAQLTSNAWGSLTFESASFTEAIDGDLVVRVGDPAPPNVPLVRIHSVCVFSEVFGSDFCDCREQLDLAMERMVAENSGLLFYLRMDGRGVGLCAKVAATAFEVDGMDTYHSRLAICVAPDARSYRGIGRYLARAGFRSVRLLTNNPTKVADLTAESVTVLPEGLSVGNPNSAIRDLYRTKVDKFGHHIPGFSQ